MPRGSFTRIPVGFAAGLASVLAVIALAVPIPYGPSLAAGAAVESDSVTACFGLRDGRNSRESTVPHDVALLPERLKRTQAPVNWYSAIFLPSHQVPKEGMWRFITRDSVEIRYHHSPSIRIATNQAQISGVVLPAGVSTAVMALMERPQAITGFAHPCSIPSTRPPNER